MKVIALIFLIILTTISGRAEAQPYENALGVRGGTQQGITWKSFRDELNAFDIILGTRNQGENTLGFRITGLYLIHAPAFDVDHLYWFYGAGGHIGFSNHHDDEFFTRNDRGGPFFGIDGTLGLEYHIQDIPFTVGIDLKPSLSISENELYFGGLFGAALSIRYVFPKEVWDYDDDF